MKSRKATVAETPAAIRELLSISWTFVGTDVSMAEV
jgi:hypothetical protein